MSAACGPLDAGEMAEGPVGMGVGGRDEVAGDVASAGAGSGVGLGMGCCCLLL